MTDNPKETLTPIKERLMRSPRAKILLTAIILLSGLLTQIEIFAHSFAPKIFGVGVILLIITLIVFLIRALNNQPASTPTDALDGAEEDQTTKPNKLTKLVKTYIDVIWVLLFGLAIIMPFVGALVSIDYFEGQTGVWGVDLSAYWNFSIDFDKLTNMATYTEGLRDSVISGDAIINVETVSVRAWYIFIAMNEVMLLITLYSLTQMRTLFASLVKGLYFTLDNAKRIQKVGIAILFGSVVVPIMQYFGGQAMLKDIIIDVPGIEISPAFQYSGDIIFLGFLLLILSGVAREAAGIYEEQLGTI